jgi:hypothetical protein
MRFLPDLRTLLLTGVVACITAAAHAQRPSYSLQLQDGWTNVEQTNLYAVISSVAGDFLQYFPDRRWPGMTVQPGGEFRLSPDAALAAKSARGVVISLPPSGMNWPDYVYQFGKALGYVAQNADVPRPHEAGWFVDSLAELGGLFSLRSLGESWSVKPLFPGWQAHAVALRSKADELMAGHYLPEKSSLRGWYEQNKEKLRQPSGNPDAAFTVAVALLPLFEANPSRWEALSAVGMRRPRNLSKTLTFAELLDEWHYCVAPKHKPFVRRVAREFGITVPLPAQ